MKTIRRIPDLLFRLLCAGLLTAALGIAPAGATPLIWETDFGAVLGDLTEEDDEEQDVMLGFMFPFLGSDYSDVSVSTNGVVGLGGDIDFTCCPDEDDLFDSEGPTIAPFWSDMDLDEMGTIHFNVFDEAIARAVFTWNAIGSFEDEFAPFTFQLQLLEDGRIIFGYNGISPTVDNLDEDLVVGLSPGNDVPDPGENDYTADSPFAGGDTIYEVFREGLEPFDLDQANLVFTPIGSFLVELIVDDLQDPPPPPPDPSIPEPATVLLLGLGLGGLFLGHRRRFARQRA